MAKPKYTFLWGDWQPTYTLDWNIDNFTEYRKFPWNQVDNIIEISENQQIMCFHSKKDIENDIERGKLFLNSKFRKNFLINLKKDYKNHWKYFKELKRINWKTKSNDKLFKAFIKAMDNCSKIISYFRATQQEGTHCIIEELKKIYKDDANTLIMSPKKDLVIKESEDWQKLVLGNFSKKKILDHAYKYPWTVMSHSTVEEAIKTLREKYQYDKENIVIKDYNKEKEGLAKKQNKILSENNKGEKLVRFVQRLNLSRMEVKSCWAGTDFYIMPLMKEIAKRSSENADDLYKYYTVEEIKALLKEKKISYEDKRKRDDCFVLLWKNGKKQFFSGKEAKKVAKEELDELYLLEQKDEIKGLSANSGRCIGIARILNANNVEQTRKFRKIFKKGEILITQMTQPNIMDIASKAGAIVTDEGGILSHAAIISREFGVPCIVGTHFATRLIKNGDKIEVDANKGVVRKKK